MQLDERVQRYLAKCPPAISGSDGHGQTFRVACALVHGFALDEAEALRFLSFYNAGCQPPWSERELRHKVQQAAKARHEKARGHLRGDGQPKPVRSGPTPVLIRARVEKEDSRTVRTLLSDLRANAGARTHTVEAGMGFRPSEASVKVKTATMAVLVPGCSTTRPTSLDLPDADWRAVESVGLAEDPVVLHALNLFGPGCRVLEAGWPE